MKNLHPLYLIFFFIFTSCNGSKQQSVETVNKPVSFTAENEVILADSTVNSYSWLEEGNYSIQNAIRNQIAPPDGYQRKAGKPGNFADWLSFLPLKAKGNPVLLFNGQEKSNQYAHFRIIDMDVGNRDLQQCADATMRLRAEYLYAVKKFDDIHFNFTNGDLADFKTWRSGKKISISQNRLKWVSSTSSNTSYKSFKNYMQYIFMYAGTASLSQELKSKPFDQINSGDILIKGGFPGHAVIIVDMAFHQSSGDKVFLLAQSYMPAQEMHILKNPNSSSLNPWYSMQDLARSGTVRTPEWTFKTSDLKSWE
ncbi:DUF4846 domain-containing protein [Flexithrix dorotheae]|uniref:DUF4846 domain-containing protein n=1 Tax=Flexithrix dorotheae TaxID=70993 RepID=UPI00035F53B0|nr:DUF4846 domain-containing protein [Flexithrix dorotheae]